MYDYDYDYDYLWGKLYSELVFSKLIKCMIINIYGGSVHSENSGSYENSDSNILNKQKINFKNEKNNTSSYTFNFNFNFYNK